MEEETGSKAGKPSVAIGGAKRARKERRIEWKLEDREDSEAFEASESSDDDAQDSDDSEGSFKRPVAKRARITSASRSLKVTPSANGAPPTSGRFVGAPRKLHPNPRLAPGILDFMLDNRCPPLLRRQIFDSLALYSAEKLVDMFPGTFKSLETVNPLAKCSIPDSYGIHSAIAGTTPSGRFSAQRVNRLSYDNHIRPDMLEYLRLFAYQKSGDWVDKATRQRLLLEKTRVDGYHDSQPFLSRHVLIMHPEPDNEYYRKIVRQVAEEEELERVAEYFSPFHRRLLYHEPGVGRGELAQARETLLNAPNGRRAASMPPGTFSNLVQRFKSAASWHDAEANALVGPLRSAAKRLLNANFPLRVVQAIAIVGYVQGPSGPLLLSSIPRWDRGSV